MQGVEGIEARYLDVRVRVFIVFVWLVCPRVDAGQLATPVQLSQGFMQPPSRAISDPAVLRLVNRVAKAPRDIA